MPRRRPSKTSLTTTGAAEYTGCSTKFLEQDRARVKKGQPGLGPPFWMLGVQHRYEIADLDAWKQSNRFDPANPPRRAAALKRARRSS